MAHLTSIGAGMYSDLSVSLSTIDPSTLTNASAESAFTALFDTESEFERIRNVREFPNMGTPPNIVNVPVYGQSTSQQIQGQSDAENLEIQLNYVADDWAAGSVLGDMVGDGSVYAFRFALLNSAPSGYEQTALSMGTVANSDFFWAGKLEALQVSPQLTDSNTATVTLSIQSPFFGAYTV